jgi:hypothetical protein
VKTGIDTDLMIIRRRVREKKEEKTTRPKRHKTNSEASTPETKRPRTE